MKEATGELSTTVITIVAIAAIIGIFTVFLLPTLRAQIALTQACNNGPGYHIVNTDGSQIDCDGVAGGNITNNQWTCTYTSADGSTGTKTCTQ